MTLLQQDALLAGLLSGHQFWFPWHFQPSWWFLFLLLPPPPIGFPLCGQVICHFFEPFFGGLDRNKCPWWQWEFEQNYGLFGEKIAGPIFTGQPTLVGPTPSKTTPTITTLTHLSSALVRTVSECKAWCASQKPKSKTKNLFPLTNHKTVREVPTNRVSDKYKLVQTHSIPSVNRNRAFLGEAPDVKNTLP